MKSSSLEKKKKIFLSDGSEFIGTSFGADKDSVFETVFNTSPTGYQEIISDPSYTDQAVVMAYPLIGNYGINSFDFESDLEGSGISALIVRDYKDSPSNFRCERTLSSYLEEKGIPGITGVDTRALIRRIRDKGSMTGCIMDYSKIFDDAKRIMESYKDRKDTVSRVSRRDIKKYDASDTKYNIACIDLGMKENIIRTFLNFDIGVTVFPYDASLNEIRKIRPDGVFFSNGPGNPKDVKSAIKLASDIRGEYPVFGICLGHQIIALSYGAKTYKLKFGHRGGNHPVKNLETGKIEITSQNHSYAVDEKSIEGTELSLTHINLLDNTIEGLRAKNDPCFSVQYHPESSPGPNDGRYIFKEFKSLIMKRKQGK